MILAAAAPGPSLALDIVAYDNGWIRADGYSIDTKTNSLTGRFENDVYHSFFLFDLPVLGEVPVAGLLHFAEGSATSHEAQANTARATHPKPWSCTR